MRALDGKTIFTLRRGGRYTVIEVNDATLESIKMPLHFDPINDDYVLEYVEDGAVKTLDIHLSRRGREEIDEIDNHSEGVRNPGPPLAGPMSK